MGQTLKKLAPGTEENKIKEISPILEKCYETHFKGTPNKELTFTDFYRAVCETVEEINKHLGNTQFCVPAESKLKQAYDENFPERMLNKQMGIYFRMGMKNHHQGQRRSLTREEFQGIFREVIFGTGFTGVGGAKDTLIYIFGVPLTALFVKQRLMPRVVPNEIFIPCITSATVFVLAKLNKI